MRPTLRNRFTRMAPALLAVAALATVALVRESPGSDHQDTPEVERNPRLDINDVWVFPGSSDSRIVLGITLASPITPAESPNARFDTDALYQIKIDNSGDAVEDLVIQFTFEDAGTTQTVNVFGPVEPAVTGKVSRLAAARPSLTGTLNQVFGSPTGIQVFAGVREDPFYLDLEQFFRIVPDRRPSRGALAELGPNPTATAFRNPGVDFFRGLNALAIFVEVPESMLRGPLAGGQIGVWATIST